MTVIISSELSITTPSDCEVVMTRTFAAPREKVFKAFTDPQQIPLWRGPRRLATEIETIDVQPGGKWRFIQRGTSGEEYAFHGVYTEVASPKRLAWTFEFEGKPGHVVTETAAFEAVGGKTKMTSTSLFESQEDRDGMLKAGMKEGASESYDRLAELLDGPLDRQVVSSRVFVAPREFVFSAWTDPKHLARWWGPKGFTNTFEEFDPRPGGHWRFTMHSPEGADYPNESVFVEVDEPKRIVFDHLRPMHWFRAEAVFEEFDDKTQVTFRMIFETAEECEQVKTQVAEANEQNLDRLAATLVEMSHPQKPL